MKHPSDAWQHLLKELDPDVVFAQEALFVAPLAHDFGEVFWSQDRGRDGGTATETLTTRFGDQRFVFAGDLNAARHLDDVYGGRWFTRDFAGLAERHSYDCHWSQHGKEVQSFWGHQAREK